jgi:hypothetical protein
MNRFLKCIGTYKCRSCNRRTRPHGGDLSAVYIQLCEECYELAGLENSILDGLNPSVETCQYYMGKLDAFGVEAKTVFPSVANYIQ